MALPKPEGRLQRLIRESARSRGFLALCMALSFAGTATAAYPVTAVVVPAAMFMPRRWRQIAAMCALGSAIGATLLVMVFHDLGWAQLYERFPELTTHATWTKVMAWTSGYGTLGLFLIAVSPLPQTPALIFFAIARHDLVGVFVAIVAGKLVKYAAFAWIATRFPDRFTNGIAGLLRIRRPENETGTGP